MTDQAKLNAMMDENAQAVMDGLSAYSDGAIDRVGSTRMKIQDILDDYSKKNDVISKARIKTLLRDIDDIEYDMYSELETEMKAALTETVQQANKQTNGALIALLGAAVVFGARSKVPKNKEVVDSTVEYVLTRKAGDGLTLLDRLRSYIGLLTGRLQSVIRYGVLRGETVHRIARRVREAYKETAWQIKRFITTELPVAYRKAVLFIGGKSGVIKAVKIIDNRGRHRNHESHECFRLAEQNMYGWGKGVYRVEDTFILSPHPQCSAYYQYILDTDKLSKGDVNAN